LRFWRTEPWNGKLFHVEQLEIGKNDAGFRCFLTAKNTVGTVGFYGATDGVSRWNITVTVNGVGTFCRIKIGICRVLGDGLFFQLGAQVRGVSIIGGDDLANETRTYSEPED